LWQVELFQLYPGYRFGRGRTSTTSNATDVAAGVFSSLIGGIALFTHSEHHFRHQRNLLKDVWDNPSESELFSPAIWRFLPGQRKDGADILRKEAIDAWRQEGGLGDPGFSDEKKRVSSSEQEEPTLRQTCEAGRDNV
jgi:hypothetical protein